MLYPRRTITLIDPSCLLGLEEPQCSRSLNMHEPAPHTLQGMHLTSLNRVSCRSLAATY